jgi:bis(5'-nucleosyl)-tetraphosphatase (symmetrical)
MSTYVIGDVQGCYNELRALLALVDFKPGRDQLVFAGDLINRGPNNLDTIKLLQDLPGTRCVLGNHDLHFLAVSRGHKSPSKSDTINDLLECQELSDISNWLLQQPLLLELNEFNSIVVHAGIPHTWSIDEASQLAAEVEQALRGKQCDSFFAQMYGNEPSGLLPEPEDQARLRVITNYLTRMRFCNEAGELELTSKADIAPEGFAPWFTFPRLDNVTIMFGHWAAIEGKTGSTQFLALDTGCVWGQSLTALRLEDRRRFSVPAQKHYKTVS